MKKKNPDAYLVQAAHKAIEFVYFDLEQAKKVAGRGPSKVFPLYRGKPIIVR